MPFATPVWLGGVIKNLQESQKRGTVMPWLDDALRRAGELPKPNNETSIRQVAVTPLSSSTMGALNKSIEDAITQIESAISRLPETKIGRRTEPEHWSFYRDWPAFIKNPTGHPRNGDYDIGATLFNAVFNQKMAYDTFYRMCRTAGKHEEK